MTIELTSRVAIRDDVLFHQLEEEAVILQLETGRYHSLNEIGTRIWLSLQRHGELELIHRDLLSIYEVEADELEQDLVQFVGDLERHDLVQVR